MAIKKAFEEADIYVSPNLLAEYRNIPLELEAEGKITRHQLEALITGIAAFVAGAMLVSPRKSVNLCRDEKDNMVLECCLEAKATFLMTGDKDLLDIKELPFDLNILTPQEFLKRT